MAKNELKGVDIPGNIKTKILVVDDHPMICHILSSFLSCNGYDVVAESRNGVDATKAIEKSDPDLVVLDIGIPGVDGISVMCRFSEKRNKPKFLVFTERSADIYVGRCRAVGASGFVSKEENLVSFGKAVDSVSNGYMYFPGLKTVPYSDIGMSEARMIESLSNRELLVFQMLIRGHRNMDVAEMMQVKTNSVHECKAKVFRKLNASSVVELVEIGRRNGLL